MPYFDHPLWPRTGEEFYQRRKRLWSGKWVLLTKERPSGGLPCEGASSSDLVAPRQVAGTTPPRRALVGNSRGSQPGANGLVHEAARRDHAVEHHPSGRSRCRGPDADATVSEPPQ